MNRKILFRGKSVGSSGEWIYGVPVSNAYITCIFKLVNGLNELKGFEVKSKTVGQYTGLTDKNGSKIFDGDIVKNIDGIYVVEYCINLTRFALVHDGLMSGRPLSFGTVIGNIHDNPELVGGTL